MIDRQEHWNRAYGAKGERGVSWFEARPAMSLQMIADACVAKDGGIIDVGGGASTLVDHLLDEGYSPLAVLDVSPQALDAARARLAERARQVEWLVADVTRFAPARQYALWHDRAVFHFLTDAQDRRDYVDSLRRALRPGGSAIIATFAPDGPSRCSGLDVARYDEASIMRELGDGLSLQDVKRHNHTTPWGADQRFIYFRLRTRE